MSPRGLKPQTTWSATTPHRATIRPIHNLSRRRVVHTVVRSSVFLALFILFGCQDPTRPDTTLTVSYNANGAGSGSVPTDATRYTSGQSVTVLGNTGSLVKSGDIFLGWNTAAAGSGTSYSGGDRFNIGVANIVLYAQWRTATALLTGTWRKTVGSNSGTKILAADGTFDFYYNAGTAANERKKGVWEITSDNRLRLQTNQLWDGTAFNAVSTDTETIPWHVENGYAYIGGLRIVTDFLIESVFPSVRTSGTSGQVVGSYAMNVVQYGTGNLNNTVRTINTDNTVSQTASTNGTVTSSWTGTWAAIDGNPNGVRVTSGAGGPSGPLRWYLSGSDYLIVAADSVTNPRDLSFQWIE